MPGPAMRPIGDNPAMTQTPSGRSTGRGNDARTHEIAAMFDRIAGVYDPMNLAISGFQEPRWRRRLVAATGLQAGGRAVDVATGTGKVAADLARRAGPGGRVVGVDISPAMLAVARRRLGQLPGLEFAEGDGLALPIEAGWADAATIAFGMRNLPDYEAGFRELRRVVRPGGVVACLEIARPRSRGARALRWWFDRVVPAIGRLVGQGDAYGYLVRSVQAYPPPDRIAELMRAAGLTSVRWAPLSAGIVTLHVGRVPIHAPSTSPPPR
jgi:demethylmenaquinone methyltransferase/2-methoxy-6-polyprenyl-1,4-benzoquinol methylase